MDTARATPASLQACSVRTLRNGLAVCRLPKFGVAALLIGSHEGMFKELARRAIAEGRHVRCLDAAGGIKNALNRIPPESVSENLQRVFLHGNP